jgi:hypothetical protein
VSLKVLVNALHGTFYTISEPGTNLIRNREVGKTSDDMKDASNKPRISRWIGRGYVVLTILLVGMYASIVVLTGILELNWAGILFTGAMMLAAVLVGVVAYCFYGTTYTIKDGHLHSWSPFATVDLEVRDIIKIEQTRVPLYFKGFGASLYSGIFFIPGFGWTKVIITNLTDGLLILDRNGKRYLITPSDPKGFSAILGH